MKKTSKMVLALLAAAVLLCGVALAEEEGLTSGIPSPMLDYASYDELIEDTGMPMADAPAGATDVTYAAIDGEPFVAQIEFTLDGGSYTYRAAYAENKEIADANTELMHGVYMQAPQATTKTLDEKELAYVVTTEGDVAVYTWYQEDIETQYSLYSATGGKDAEAMDKVFALVVDVPEQTEEE